MKSEGSGRNRTAQLSPPFVLAARGRQRALRSVEPSCEELVSLIRRFPSANSA